jgi:hypothetical protein
MDKESVIRKFGRVLIPIVTPFREKGDVENLCPKKCLRIHS